MSAPAPVVADGAIVGHGTVTGGNLDSELHRATLGLGLRHAHRGRGLGRRLLAATIDWCRAHPELDRLDLGAFAGTDAAP